MRLPAAQAISGVVPPLAKFLSENTVGKNVLIECFVKQF